MSRLRVVFTSVFLALLCACSNGNSNSDSPLYGQFIDSAVSGVRFSTETRSGVTDSEGRFEYLAGETVSFYLGDLLLGDAPGAAIISPFDLVDDVQPVVGGALRKAILEKPQHPSFSTVINMAILLQTVDVDGDPENGIEITPDVASLFTPDSIDFNLPWQAFSYDKGFRQAMAEAKTRSLLDGARQARKPWRAIAHLYASLGVESKLRVERVVSGDTDTDGNANYTVRNEFDAEGKLARQVFDYSDDDQPGRIRTYTYDIDGNLLRHEEDDNNDGTLDSITEYAYDADGNQSIYAYDIDGDGKFDNVNTDTYDTRGNRIRSESDTDGNGAPDEISKYKYDAEGNLSGIEHDVNGDGKTDYISSYSYFVDGNSIRSEVDSDSDGAADGIGTTIYDAEGNTLREEYDVGADGAPDSIFTYSYDENGNNTRSEYDFDADGALDFITTSTYDTNGNITLYTFDSNGRGSPEQIHTLNYDEGGYEVRREQDLNASGSPNRIITTTYDSDSDGWWWTFNRGRRFVSFVPTLSGGFDPNNSSGSINRRASQGLILSTSATPMLELK